MDAGKLNQRITFLVQTSALDDHGQAAGTWAPAATDPTVWAALATVGTRDIAAGGGLQAMVDVKWIVRYRADVQPTWRVQWGGVIYAIVGEPGPLPGGTEWLEIRGSKVVA